MPSAGPDLDDAKPVKVDALRVAVEPCDLPLDIAVQNVYSWTSIARTQPPAERTVGRRRVRQGLVRKCQQYDLNQTALPITLAAMRLGEVGMVFHPAEMYSCYGLAIRRDSPLADTLVVGYADGTIGYGPDVNAYKAGEYAAVVVPKILDYPPLVPTATQTLAESALGLLKKVAG